MLEEDLSALIAFRVKKSDCVFEFGRVFGLAVCFAGEFGKGRGHGSRELGRKIPGVRQERI